ncbi:MAG: TlpA family protein disulfide reductase [Henriciella sp.]|nr:TlpA family protein disulfide reductase [Henriciella sp.]MBO6696196.1 TlpA family protein disulfide reductase [Henriciella sp.]
MDRFLRIAIPTMFAGVALALLYWLFSASSKGSNRDPVAKLAVGTLSKLDVSDKGAPAPPAPFVDGAGNVVRYQDFEGQAILVNFWATWCGPCEREMPSLAALERSRGSDTFKVIAISVDEPSDHDYAKTRLRELTNSGLDFYTLADGPEGWNIVYDSGAGGGFPTTILYDRNGLKVAKLEGDTDWASYEAVALVDLISKD